MKKNYAVQVYRILCTLIICWHHFQGAVGKIEILKHGYICVEFFFILSGYFLARYFAEEETNGGHSTVGYLLHRIKRLYPEYCFAAVVAILIIGIGGHKFTPVKAIAEMLMIQYLGIIGGGIILLAGICRFCCVPVFSYMECLFKIKIYIFG